MTGTGKLSFAGQNINNAPFYASLAAETKYWFLDGFASTQFLTSPLSLVSTKPYLKDWLISTVIRVESPDGTRSTMLKAVAALASLFDPQLGEQRLIFDEFPDSYFMAKLQKSTVTNETQSPYMLSLDITFACTGPAYALQEQVVRVPVTDHYTYFTVESYGDAPSKPKFRFIPGDSFSSALRFTNTDTGETVRWAGNLKFGDILDINIGEEYGTPYTAMVNGASSITSLIGPAWPHIMPGVNGFYFKQAEDVAAITGEVEVRWHDRYLIGAVTAEPSTPVPTIRLPTKLSIAGTGTATPGYTFSGQLIDINFNMIKGAYVELQQTGDPPSGVQHWSGAYPGYTGENGMWSYKLPPIGGGDRWFRAWYPGSSVYLEDYSPQVNAPMHRLATVMTLQYEHSGQLYTFYGALANGVGGPRILNAPLTLQMSTDNANWGAVSANEHTGSTGDYGIFLTLGSWGTLYFRTYYEGDATYAAVYSNVITVNTLGQSPPGQPSVAPGPVEYQVGMHPTMVNDGELQYFGARGFTTCILIPTTKDTFEDELHLIESYGMKPIIDVEMILGMALEPEKHAEWFQALADVGWDFVACEVGREGIATYMKQFFSGGYVNFNISAGGLWRYIYTDPNTILNDWECYYERQVPWVIEGTKEAAAVGIPNGLICGDWPTEIQANSTTGAEPSYQSLFDWSYANGVPFTTFLVWIYPSQNKIPTVLELGIDKIVTDLQKKYPPAGSWIKPAQEAGMMTIAATKSDEDGTYTFEGTLTNLVTMVPIVGAELFCEISEDGGTTWDVMDIDDNPTTTDSSGYYSWTGITYDAGWHDFIVYYAGDESHMQVESMRWRSWW
jgi:hypothetical protein